MIRLILKKKRIVAGLLLGAVIIAGIALPLDVSNVVHAATEKTECSWYEFGCFVQKTLPGFITGVILTITSWFLGVAGYLLNEVIRFTVVEMANNIRGIDGINIAWKAFRDLSNLIFIFILLYIAIGTILRLDGVNIKKLLVNVVIIALLLNFSLFFTKILIDTSNIVTIGFYNSISTSTTSGNSGATGLSGAFMNKLGIVSVFDVTGTADFIKNSGGDAGKVLLLGLFGGILFLVTAFVFMAAALMFIIRYVTLILLMILSPLAFAAMALPKDSYSKKWWSKLWENIIFAPVFMILVWATLTVMDGVLANRSVGGVDAMIKAINQPGVSMGLIMNFIIVIVMMVATLIVSKEIGAAGAKGALKMGKKISGQVTSRIGSATGAIAFGTGALAARRSLGLIGREIADSERLKDAQSKGGIRGLGAQLVRGTGKVAAKGSYDVRATAIGGGVSKSLGLGKAGGKGGYDKYIEEKEKEADKTRKELDTSGLKTDRAQQELKRVQEEKKSYQRKESESLNSLTNSIKSLETEIDAKETEIKKKEVGTDEEKLDATYLRGEVGLKKARLAILKSEHSSAEGVYDRKIKDAQDTVDKLKGVGEDDAKKRFTDSGERASAEQEFESSGLKAEATQRGKDAGLKADQLNKFVEKAQDEYLKKVEKEFVSNVKRDSIGKIRASEYAKNLVDNPWDKRFKLYASKQAKNENRPMFGQRTRYVQAAKIRKEIGKSKGDRNIEKVIDALKKGDKDEAKKSGGIEGKEEGEKGEE